MANITGLHHIAVICSDYEKSKRFYIEVLGFQVIAETHRIERQSYKLDLLMPGGIQLELFSFLDAPPRPSYPEALGLRHLALSVTNLEQEASRLNGLGIETEPIRIDELTGKKYTFFPDPDGLPIELYES